MAKRKSDPDQESKAAELDFVDKVWTKYSKWKTDSQPWRDECEEDYEFAAGHQWDEDDLEKLNDEERPIITFNRIATVISAVLGLEANHRQEVSYKAIHIPDDSVMEEKLNEISKWVRKKGDHDLAEAEAIEDMVVCGMGWTEQRVDYDTDPHGRIIKERVDPREMYWETSASKRNLEDKRGVIRAKRMTREEVAEQWPNADVEEIEIREGGMGHRAVGDQYAQRDLTDSSGKRSGILVLHYQWFERKEYLRVQDQAGKIMFLNQEQYDSIPGDPQTAQKPPFLRMKRRVYYQAFIAGKTLLEKGLAPCQTGFTYECMTGKRDHARHQWFGLVRLAKDPQRWSNKLFSLLLDIIASNAKGGIMVENGAVADIVRFEEDWSKTNSVARLNAGAISGQKIMPKPAAPYPQGIDRLMTMAIDCVRESMGVNVEMLGMADRVQTGILEQERKRSAYTILAPIFDAVKSYRAQSGMTTLYMIQNYLPPSRIAMVLHVQEQELIPIIKNTDLANIEVSVDEAEDSPNNMDRIWVMIQQVVPWLLKASVPMPPEILDYSPLPTKLTAAWKALLERAMSAPPNPRVQAETEKTVSETQVNQAKAAKTAAEAAAIDRGEG